MSICKEIHGCFLLVTKYETPVGVSKDPRNRNVYVFLGSDRKVKDPIHAESLVFLLMCNRVKDMCYV